MGSSGDFEEFSIYCENGEWLEFRNEQTVFARPGPIVHGARRRRGLVSQFSIILRLTEPVDEVVLGFKRSRDFGTFEGRLRTHRPKYCKPFFGLYCTLPLSLFMVFSMNRNSRQGALPVLRRRCRTAYI